MTSIESRSDADKGVAVVTGGSAGLGRAVVRAFAAAGYDVAVLARVPTGWPGRSRTWRRPAGGGWRSNATCPSMLPWKRRPTGWSGSWARSRYG